MSLQEKLELKPEAVDQYLDANILLPRRDHMVRVCVVAHKNDTVQTIMG